MLHVLARGSLEVKERRGRRYPSGRDREEMSSRRLVVARFPIDKVT